MNEPLGLIAGEGNLPRRAVREMKQQKRSVVVAGLEPGTEGAYDDVDRFRRFDPGQLGSLPEYFQGEGVEELIMLGDVDKSRLFDSRARERADSVVSSILDSVSGRGDLDLVKAAAKYLRLRGLTLLGIDELFPDWLTPRRHLAGPEPSEESRRTREVLAPVAGWLADREVGQTVLGRRRTVVALEALEGTFECIDRAGSLAGPGCVMVKRARSDQDLRFDVPVTGEETLWKLVDIEASALFLEAGSTVWVERPSCRRLAEEHDISLVGWKETPSWKRWLPGFNE